MDPEAALKSAAVSRKQFKRDVVRVCQSADILLEVIDARDPIGTRATEIEENAHTAGKKLIVVINKIDMVP